MASANDNNPQAKRGFRDRFPMFARLERSVSRKRIPFIQQATNADCGVACLAMILAYHGRRISPETIRNQLGADRDGTSALEILNVARYHRLRGNGISLDIGDLGYLPKASILHWEFNHFVVFDGLYGDRIRIVDPRSGVLTLSREEFSRSFTGVALTFEPKADFDRTPGAAGMTWEFFKIILKKSGMLARILSLSGLAQIIGLGLPILTGILVDRVIPRNDLGLLQILMVGFAFLAVFQFLTAFVRSHLLLYLRTELDARMTLDFLEHLFELPFSFFQLRSAGDLMMRLSSNATVREIITSGALSGTLDGIMVFSYLLLIFVISPAIGGLVVLLGLLRVVIFLATRHRVRDLMAQYLARQANLQSYQVQMFNGIETLKAVGAEPRALSRWANLFVDTLNISITRGRLDAIIQALIGSLGFVSPLVILLAGGRMVINGEISIGTMLALNALAGGFLTPLSSLINTGLTFQQLGGYVDRLDDVLSATKEQDDAKVVQSPKITGHIEIENVSFRYSAAGPLVLQDVSVNIEAGKHVAIVGRSGAGKTTLANLMLGLYRPTQGRVLYDDRDLTTIDTRSFRTQLGVVVQQTHLFSGSIRSNIALANPEMPLDAVIRAAKLAQIHGEILAMPMGYDSLISDGGGSLSGGQRQRLAIARALANNPAVLLFDEATSSLDIENEATIQADIQELGCTRIVVAHRLSTVQRADIILVLDEGRLVECGNHNELVAAGKIYARLVAGQI